MELLIKYKKSLAPFVRNEMSKYSSKFEELNDGMAVIDADISKVLINSALVESASILIGYTDNFHNIKDLKNAAKSGESFKVKCGEKNVCIELGQMIKDATNASVSLDNPDRTIIAEKLGNKYLIYTSEIKLSNRGYSSSNDEFITPDAARAMVEYSGWEDNGIFADAFCGDGYIIIEAALKALNVGPGFFKSKDFSFEVKTPVVKKLKSPLLCMSNDMNEIKFAKQNSRLARVFKYLTFMVHNVEDLDYKMKEASVDCLVSALPKRINIDKLFFQLEYIMKADCIVVLLTNEDVSGAIKEYGFRIIDETMIESKKLIKLVKI